MRAKEFINEAEVKTPPQKIPPTGTVAPGGTPTAPTLGAPAASKKNSQDVLKNLARAGEVQNLPQNKQSTGFMSGLAQGFKKGMGIDPTKSLTANLSAAGLEKLGMSNTAGVATQQATKTLTPTISAPGVGQMPKPGQTIKDPITGKGSVKILPNPGGKGVKLDTTRTLGYPIIVDPKDLA